MILRSIAWTVIVFMVSTTVEYTFHAWMTNARAIVVDNIVTSAVMGFLIYVSFRTRYREEKFLNHHIRNSLTVIAYANACDLPERTKMVSDAIQRILYALEQWTAREELK